MTGIHTPGLDRHVRPAGDGLDGLLDEHGFLRALGPDGLWWYGASPPVAVTDLTGSGSFVLLAPGGAGKTTVLDALRSHEPTATVIDFSLYDKRGMHDQFATAVGARRPVYLDGLDVAVREEPAALRILQHYLTKPEASDIPWRLACRPAAWDGSLSAALDSSLTGFRELALLPLTRDAAAALAERVGVPQDFLDAVIEARLGRLAASPLRFQAAARRWREDHRLPENHLAAIAHEVDRMLSETAPAVVPSLPHDRAVRVAMRLAAMSVFGGINRYARSNEPDARGRCPLAELPSAPEPDEPGTPVGPAEYEAVIGTALFDAADGGAVVFHHQQYAEYLAARYVAERSSVTGAQVRDLLGVGPDGRVAGALAGVVAWLLALRPALVEDLVLANAQLLVQAGVEVPADEIRGYLATALLEIAAAGESEPEWHFDLGSLGHPALEGDLRRHLVDGLTDPGHLWWVARLADVGNCTGLAELLLKEALDERWPAWARRPAAAAVAASGNALTTAQLTALLLLGVDEDPDDELLSAGIEALYPQLLDTEELLAALRPRRNRSLVGGYLVLLGDLAERIPVRDLPLALDWAASQENGGDDCYGRFPERLVEVGWRCAGTESVRAALGRLVARLISTPSRTSWSFRRRPPWDGAASGERRRLLIPVAEALDTDYAYELIRQGLATNEDAEYILTRLPELPTAAQTVLTEVLLCLLNDPSRAQADAILRLIEGHPAYEATRDLRGAIPLNSPVLQPLRRWRERDLQVERQKAERRERHRERLTRALAATQANLGDWWQLVAALAEDDSPHDHYFTHDLRRRPGWILLDETERENLLETGLRYLEQHEPVQAARHLEEIQLNEVLPDWSGVYMLTTLVAHQPDVVHALDLTAWRRWAPAIVTAWSHSLDEDRELRQDLLTLAPANARVLLSEAALSALPSGAEFLPQYQTYRHLIPEMATELGVRLVRGDYSGALGQNLLNLMVEHAPAAARELSSRLLDAGPASIRPAALRGLAALDPDCVAHMCEAGELSPDEILQTVPHLSLPALSDSSLGPLARLLLDRLPIAEDPPWEEQGLSSHNAYRARDSVLDQLASRGLATTLAELQAGREGADRLALANHLRRARLRAADLAFRPVKPTELLALLGRADARLVRSDRDLLEVVLEALRALQMVISREAYRDLWNLGDVPRPKSEDDISDWVRRNLEQYLGAGAVIGRELQVRRPHEQGIGTRIDLTATVSTATQSRSQSTVIAEAKLVNHDELLTAMKAQLVERYLVPTGLRCGIYLVYWVPSAQRPPGWRRNRKDLEGLWSELNAQALAFGPQLTIAPFVLDIGRPIS